MKRIPLFLALFSLVTPQLYAEDSCPSCVRLRNSHQDNIDQGGYYEDTEYYKNNIQKNRSDAPPPASSSTQQTPKGKVLKKRAN